MQSLRISVLQAGLGLLMVAISLFAATQWAAAMLGHQPALGSPWIDLLGLKVYAPWKLFVWWLSFDAQAPDVFARAGAVAAFGGIASGAVAIGGAAWRASLNKQATTYGSARWADCPMCAMPTCLPTRASCWASTTSRYLRHDGPEHVLAVAPTRSGKGVGLVVPTLLTWPGSAVVHDIKGENWELTAGWRAKFSHCLLFDPTNPGSARFNPLLEVRKGPGEVRDVQNIADILVDPEGARERRDHWEKTAHALLVGAILHVLYAEEEKTLARVATFLADPARSIRRTLWIMLTTNHLGTDAEPLGAPGGRLGRPRAAEQVRKRTLRRRVDGHELLEPLPRSDHRRHDGAVRLAHRRSDASRAPRLALPGGAALRHLAHACRSSD